MEDAEVSAFLDRVRAWLKATHDPRLIVLADGREQITDLAQACADFCDYMARTTEQAQQS